MLLTPHEEELSAAVSSLIAGLLAATAVRPDVLYVGPITRREVVERAAIAATRQAGRTLAAADEAEEASGAVVLAEAAEIPLFLERRVEGQLWVVWGDREPEALPAAFRTRVEERGYLFDVRSNPVGTGHRSDLRSVLRAAAQTGASGFPVLVSTSRDTVAMTAAEVQLRLRTERFFPVQIVDALPSTVEVFTFADGPHPALVACVEEPAREAVLERIVALQRRARDRGAGLVVVAPPETVHALEEFPAWSRTAGAAPHARTARPEVPEAIARAPWPPIEELILGAPGGGRLQDPTFYVPPGGKSFDEVLQMAESMRQPGYFLLYHSRGFGWVAVDDDYVTGAARLGDADRGDGAGEVSARIRQMVLWPELRVVFVPGGTPREALSAAVRLPMGMVGTDVSRTLDESRAGTVAAGSLAAEPDPVPPGRVARELVHWGVPRLAVDLLHDTERASGWGVEEELLLGHLVLERDPEEALARLKHAVVRLGQEDDGARWEVQVAATLNALLLEARSRPSYALAAWAHVSRWLASAGEHWVEGPRHAAILFELAARAGDADAADRFRVQVLEGTDRSLADRVARVDPEALLRRSA